MLKNIFLYIVIQFLIFYSALYAELVSPVNNSILNYVHVLFEWDQIPDALEYRFQVSSEDDFSSVVSDTIVSSLVFIDRNNIEWSSNYFWRIRPVYYNQQGSWSDANIFSTDAKRSDATANLYLSLIHI